MSAVSFQPDAARVATTPNEERAETAKERLLDRKCFANMAVYKTSLVIQHMHQACAVKMVWRNQYGSL